MIARKALPAGPKSPPAVQLLHWIFRPIPFMRDCARRYGPCFTVRLPRNPPFVLFSTPEAVKEIFTGDPEQLPAGETREILRPWSVDTPCSCSTARAINTTGGLWRRLFMASVCGPTVRSCAR